MIGTLLGAGLLAGCSATSSSAGGENAAHGGEAALALPDLSQATVWMGTSGTALLWISLVICLLGFGFGIRSYAMLRSLPVHKSMLEISELIYETCKAYLFKQGRFLMILWIFITTVIVIYYKFLTHFTWGRTLIIVFFSLLGMAGSYAVA